MSLDQHPRLQEAIYNGYDFNISQYIKEGFDIFKQNIGGFIAYFFVYGAILTIMGLIPILGNIASIIIGPPLAVGWYLVAHKIQKRETTEFGDFFKGFDFIGPLILVSIVSSLIYVTTLIPFFIANGALFQQLSDIYAGVEYDLDPDFPTWTILLMLPIFYLSVAWRWAPMFVVFYKFGFWEALETSRQLVTKKWFSHFAFMLLFMLFALGGMLALVIGLLFVIPMILAMDYAAFADVTGLMEAESKEDDIVEHLID